MSDVDKKSREFWVEKMPEFGSVNYCYNSEPDWEAMEKTSGEKLWNKEEIIHVIEFSAYEKAQDEIALLKFNLEQEKKNTLFAAQELKKLKEKLQWRVNLILNQDRTKGYPTGSEWTFLVKELKRSKKEGGL